MPPRLSRSFEYEHPLAQQHAEGHGGERITPTGVSTETRAAIRAMIKRAFKDGITVYEAAKLIKNMVGVNAQQAHAAMNYRARMQAQGMSATAIQTALAKYTAKQIETRAETIARTEVMTALNAGEYEAALQAQAQGYLSAGALVEWIVTADEKLCGECNATNGQRRLLGQPFNVGAAEVLHPPAHPRCRCTIKIVDEADVGLEVGEAADRGPEEEGADELEEALLAEQYAEVEPPAPKPIEADSKYEDAHRVFEEAIEAGRDPLAALREWAERRAAETDGENVAAVLRRLREEGHSIPEGLYAPDQAQVLADALTQFVDDATGGIDRSGMTQVRGAVDDWLRGAMMEHAPDELAAAYQRFWNNQGLGTPPPTADAERLGYGLRLALRDIVRAPGADRDRIVAAVEAWMGRVREMGENSEAIRQAVMEYYRNPLLPQQDLTSLDKRLAAPPGAGAPIDGFAYTGKLTEFNLNDPNIAWSMGTKTRNEVAGILGMDPYRVGTTPESFLDTLKTAFGNAGPEMLQKLGSIAQAILPRGEVSISVDGGAKGMVLTITTSDSRVGHMTRDMFYRVEPWNPNGKLVLEVHHAYFSLHEERQNEGRADAMMALSLQTYLEAGVQRVSVMANIDIGGYTWAKAGFRATKPELFVEMIKATAGWEDQEYYEYSGKTKVGGPKRISEERKQQLLEGMEQAGPDAPKWLAAQPEGKYLLIGTSWSGAIDLGSAHGQAVTREAVARARTRFGLGA